MPPNERTLSDGAASKDSTPWTVQEASTCATTIFCPVDSIVDRQGFTAKGLCEDVRGHIQVFLADLDAEARSGLHLAVMSRERATDS